VTHSRLHTSRDIYYMGLDFIPALIYIYSFIVYDKKAILLIKSHSYAFLQSSSTEHNQYWAMREVLGKEIKREHLYGLKHLSVNSLITSMTQISLTYWDKFDTDITDILRQVWHRYHWHTETSLTQISLTYWVRFDTDITDILRQVWQSIYHWAMMPLGSPRYTYTYMAHITVRRTIMFIPHLNYRLYITRVSLIID